MLAGYPHHPVQGWAQQPRHVVDDEQPSFHQQHYHSLPQHHQFTFEFGKQPSGGGAPQSHQQAPAPAPAPAQPLILDDGGFRFSHYIAQQQQQRQQTQQPQSSPPTPSTPALSATYSKRSSFSSVGPFSAITPSSGSFPSSNTSTYTELQGFSTYSPSFSQAAPVLGHPNIPQRQIPSTTPTQHTSTQQEIKTEKPEVKRPSGACTRCKKMKMKCEFLSPNDQTCQRCRVGRYECIVEGRKQRKPSERESLLAQHRQVDAMLATLLKGYYNPSEVTPITMASSKLSLPREDRAMHREALLWAEKGAPASSTGASQRYRMRCKDRERFKAREDTADDDDWSSSSDDESEDGWDSDVEVAFTTNNIGETRLYAHALPDGDTPLGLIARLSLEDGESASNAGTKRPAEKMVDETEAEQKEMHWGVANPDFFQPGPAANLSIRRVLNERDTPPVIIASGLISWSEAEKLFEIFFQHINPYVSVLDPVIHTTSSVYERCPFLFTVVCAISLRYFPSRPGIYKIAMHFAKTAAATALVDGFKSVELAQGYILLATYGPAARRWEEDRSWFYGGLASRIATDLSLHRAMSVTPLSERHERELLNRVRVWLICFTIDRASSTQFGKPTGLQENDVVKNAKEWYRQSKYNHPYDVHLMGYTELLRVFSRFHQQIYSDPRTPNGLNKQCDFRAITEATEREMRACLEDVECRYANDSDPNDPGCVLRARGVPIFENYMRLVMYSFGFEDAWRRRGVEPGDMFFAKCLSSASVVVRQLTEVYGPNGYLKYAPDCFFVMGGFCSAFLLKLLRPEFDTLLDQAQRVRIVQLVTNFVNVLASPAVSIDDSHTPMLYAKFLHGQLRHVKTRPVHKEEIKKEERSVEVSPQGVPEAESSATTPQPTTPEVFSHSTPGSSSGSSVPTPGPDQWPDSWTDGSGSVTTRECGGPVGGDDPMELCQEDYLATMQAISSEHWANTMLMPGFGWPQDDVASYVGSVAGGMPFVHMS